MDILGNTGLHRSPSELLEADAFHAFLADLRQYYDIILMESAALNDYSDALELEPFAEKVIAVFNANSSLGNKDQASIDYLRNLGDKLAGSILTEVDVKKG